MQESKNKDKNTQKKTNNHLSLKTGQRLLLAVFLCSVYCGVVQSDCCGKGCCFSSNFVAGDGCEVIFATQLSLCVLLSGLWE